MGKISHLLPHTVYKKTLTKVYSEIGTSTQTHTTGTTPYKVRIAVKKGELVTEEPGALKEFSHEMSSETEFNEGDVIVWGSIEFRIIRKHSPYGMKELHHYLYYLVQLR